MSENLSSEKIFGIDLGTTYSAISWIDPDGKATILENAEGNRITPSVVFFETESNTIVGQVAKDGAKADPGNAVSFIKRYMGTTQEERESSSEAPSLNFWGKEYTPEDVSAIILAKLVQDATATTQIPVKKVVITCPAYFGEKERSATRIAGEIAGLEVVQVLDEPAAAALCYALDGSQEKTFSDKNILVYDLGGGTFDATVLRMAAEGGIDVVCTDGDHRLGGKDWDDRVVTYLAEQFNVETNTSDNILDDIDTAYDLQISAEKLKQLLSGKEESSQTVTHAGEKAKISLTRERFDELTSDLLERTFTCTDLVRKIAEDKGITKIDEILLVGGSTRMRQVEEGVKQRYGAAYGVEPRRYEPDTAVAKGAALFSHAKYIKSLLEDEIEKKVQEAGGRDNLSTEKLEKIEKEAIAALSASTGMAVGKIEDVIKKGDVTLAATQSYGIALSTGSGQRVFKMIERQKSLPYKVDQAAFTVVENQSSVKFEVFSFPTTDDDLDLADCVLVGDGELELPSGLPASTPLRCTAELTEKNELHFEGEQMEPARGSEPNVVFLKPFASEEEIPFLPTGRILRFTLEVEGGMSEEAIAESRQAISAMSIE